MRTADGEYFEVHEPLSPEDRWVLVQHESHRPIELDAVGRRSGVQRARARLSQWFFEDRIEPVTPSELEAAHHEGGQHGEALASAEERPAIGSGQQ